MKMSDLKKDPLVKFTEDGGAVVQLMKSLKIGKGKDAQSIDQLVFHPPTVADFEAQGLAEHKFQAARYLVASLTDQPSAVFLKMGFRDFERCSLVAQYMTDGDPKEEEPQDESRSEGSESES